MLPFLLGTDKSPSLPHPSKSSHQFFSTTGVPPLISFKNIDAQEKRVKFNQQAREYVVLRRVFNAVKLNSPKHLHFHISDQLLSVPISRIPGVKTMYIIINSIISIACIAARGVT